MRSRQARATSSQVALPALMVRTISLAVSVCNDVVRPLRLIVHPLAMLGDPVVIELGLGQVDDAINQT